MHYAIDYNDWEYINHEVVSPYMRFESPLWRMIEDRFFDDDEEAWREAHGWVDPDDLCDAACWKHRDKEQKRQVRAIQCRHGSHYRLPRRGYGWKSHRTHQAHGREHVRVVDVIDYINGLYPVS